MSDFNPIDGLSNFFLYLHLCTGKIDDLNDLEKELSLLHDKPVSVVIVVLRSEEVKINNDFVQIQERMIKFQQRTRKFITFIRIDLNTKKIEFKKKINRIIWESISHFESFIDKFRFELDRKEHKSIELESNLLKLSALDINHQSFVNPSIFEDNSEIIKSGHDISYKSEETILKKIIKNLCQDSMIVNELHRSIVRRTMAVNDPEPLIK